jgi:hypothetical protein
MMNNSDIPDPASLDDQLVGLDPIQETGADHVNTSIDDEQQRRQRKYSWKNKEFKASIRRNCLSDDEEEFHTPRGGQRWKFVLNQEDYELIYLIKKQIAFSENRSEFMREIEKFIVVFERNTSPST